MAELLRKGHFLGAKLRTLRKRNGLTLEELSVRCIQRDAQRGPSVSYLSMIESGKRSPSPALLELLAGGVPARAGSGSSTRARELEPAAPTAAGGAATRVPLEPAFLFSKTLLQAAIPELLAQTGTTGRQFAHLLIRSHQEMSRNDFPDLERAADSVGERRFPLSVEDLMRLCRRHGLEIRWFDRKPRAGARQGPRGAQHGALVLRGAAASIYANRALQSDPARLKFDLAAHIAHKVLHGGDGLKSPHATGGEMGGSPEGGSSAAGMNAQDVLHAWRDFECSFFAGALLAPRVPFRRFLARERYRVEAGAKLELTPAVVMRRMTKVSPYPYWHFFDAYPPGYLRAVYRGNGIPLPWGNLAQVSDPCPNWAVFRMIDGEHGESRLADLGAARRRALAPLLLPLDARARHGRQSARAVGRRRSRAGARTHSVAERGRLVESIFRECLHRRGEARIPKAAAQVLGAVANVLNIAWIEDALGAPGAHHLPAQQPLPAAGALRGRPALARPRDRRRARGDPRARRLMA